MPAEHRMMTIGAACEAASVFKQRITSLIFRKRLIDMVVNVFIPSLRHPSFLDKQKGGRLFGRRKWVSEVLNANTRLSPNALHQSASVNTLKAARRYGPGSTVPPTDPATVNGSTRRFTPPNMSATSRII
jgi:hypothetical protein